MKLHKNEKEFLEAIQATAQNFGVREVYIEKDYWVTFLLYRLSQSEDRPRVIFKGGTSLSKAYKVVRRFSEDVDLAILRENLTNSQTEKLIEKISKELTIEPIKETHQAGITSKMGMSRRTLHSYPRKVQQGNFGPVREHLLLEVNCFGKPTPFKAMEIGSMIGEFLKSKNEMDLMAEYGLDAFQVQVLDWRVTFLEKILSLAYASFNDGENLGVELRARVRHFYDLATMCLDPEIQKFVSSKDSLKMLADIRADEKLDTRRKWSNNKLKEAPLFKDLKKFLPNVESYYEQDIESLVFTFQDLTDFKYVKKCFEAIFEMVKKE